MGRAHAVEGRTDTTGVLYLLLSTTAYTLEHIKQKYNLIFKNVRFSHVVVAHTLTFSKYKQQETLPQNII